MKLKKIKIFCQLLLFVGTVLIVISFISGYFSQRVAIYIKQKATLLSSSYIEEAIREEVIPTIDVEQLIMTKTIGDKVDSVYINTNQVNSIIANVNSSLQNNIYNDDGLDALTNLTLPLGIIFSETLFTNLGPEISIDILPVGSFKSDIVTNIQEYGINNSLLTIDIVVKINFETIVPLNKQGIEVVTNIPIVVQLIQGSIPNYYYHNTNSEFIPGTNIN